MSTRRFFSIPIVALGLAAVLAIPASAEAQRRGPARGGRSRVIVSAGFGYGYPTFWLYDQWGPWGPWGPYGPGPYGPYRPYPYNDFIASVKLDVEPNDADVYVDGALAGQVDDFDGIFQSLKVRPGGHEIVVYREGYRSVREQIYVEPYHTRKLRFDLERLRAGEAPDPRPVPPPDERMIDPRERPRQIPRQEPPPPPRGRQPEPRREPEPRQQPAQFGTLSLRIVPADAEVIVDGERWSGPATSDRLSIQLAAGRHRIEVRKQGLNTYSEEVLIRQGSTLTLNVSLK